MGENRRADRRDDGGTGIGAVIRENKALVILTVVAVAAVVALAIFG